MVIVFAHKNTKLFKGTYSSVNGFEIEEGDISEKYVVSIQNSLKILLQQDNEKLQFVHSILGRDMNILIICKRIDDILKFSIINNPIFKSRSAYDLIFQRLQILTLNNEFDLINNSLSFLISIERSFNELEPDDYLNYMPLLSNYLFEIIHSDIKENDSDINKQLINQYPNTTYAYLHELFLEENSSDAEKISNLTEAYRLCPFSEESYQIDSNQEYEFDECFRFYFNMLILAMQLDKHDIFSIVFQYILKERVNLTRTKFDVFLNMLAAHWFLLEDAQKAYGYIIQVRNDALQHLSIKSQINYLRLKGAIFEKLGKYSESLNEYLTCVSLLNNLENLTPSAALAYAGIGNINSITGQFTKAITAYSFAASLFDYLSLKSHKISMLNNILILRTLKAKSYLSACLVSLNNERYKVAEEYIERTIHEISSLLMETPHKQIPETVKEAVSLLNPLVLRKDVEKNLAINLDTSFQYLDSFLDVCHTLKETGRIDEVIVKQLKELAIPRKTIVNQVVLIHKDGRYITSFNSEDKLLEKDKNMIFAGAMTAIQMLLKEVIQSEAIHTIDAGENQILLRKADLIQIVIIANKITEEIITAADELIENILKEYSYILDDWDGSLVELKKTSSLIKELIYDRINE